VREGVLRLLGQLALGGLAHLALGQAGVIRGALLAVHQHAIALVDPGVDGLQALAGGGVDQVAVAIGVQLSGDLVIRGADGVGIGPGVDPQQLVVAVAVQHRVHLLGEREQPGRP
jgi:hypothetical protein